MKPKKTLREFFSFYFGLIGFATGSIPLCILSVILNLKPSNTVGNTISILGKKAVSPALSSLLPCAGFLISCTDILDDNDKVANNSYKPRDFDYGKMAKSLAESLNKNEYSFDYSKSLLHSYKEKESFK